MLLALVFQCCGRLMPQQMCISQQLMKPTAAQQQTQLLALLILLRGAPSGPGQLVRRGHGQGGTLVV